MHRAFTLSKENFEQPQVELQRSWFQAWGFAEPEPPKDAKGAGMGMGMGGGAKGKGKGKKGPPKAASKAKLFAKAPGDDLVTVFRADLEQDSAEFSPEDLASWGEVARGVIEEALPKTGAVLLRGLPMRSAEDFSHFWKGHLSTTPALEEGRYNSLGPSGGRDKLSGIDLATNVPPQFLLLCHNEVSLCSTIAGNRRREFDVVCCNPADVLQPQDDRAHCAVLRSGRARRRGDHHRAQ